ncbi:hypothetical protein SAMN05444359_102168 [Neolewinella agarilytica]|uniref:Uncharacterized protein n=1 Tax=Neolewinella agarilytica TaxID=478744 RepID=A0A1H9AP33_9BACT|nr:hypothetical protein SAMN05444359_102168 [Neolewinella agarilytica]
MIKCSYCNRTESFNRQFRSHHITKCLHTLFIVFSYLKSSYQTSLNK